MKKITLAFMILIMAGPVWGEDVLRFVYSDTFPPYSWKEDGQMKGILIDIADEAVGRRMGIAISHEIHPWARAQHLVQTKRADALITNGPFRDKWAEYSNETVLFLEMKLYAKAGGPKFEKLKEVRTLDDLRGYKIIGHRGSGWDKNILEGKKFDIQWVTDMDFIYKLLNYEKGDVNVNASHVAGYHIKNLGLQNQIAELATMDTLPFHLVIGKTSLYTKIIPKFDETIKQMKQDGSLEKIFDKYR